MIPGEYFLASTPIEANAGRPVIKIGVTNTGDRPVQIGSHYHFFEVNKGLLFDRGRAFGLRLNIPAGTAVRFEPGEEKEIELTPFGGRRIVQGFGNLVNGETKSPEAKKTAMEKALAQGFKNKTT
jgi:urease subunit beta